MQILNSKTAAFWAIISTHCRGKLNAKTASELKFNGWGNAREIRTMVSELRTKGYPLCSSNEGYYAATNMLELMTTVSRIRCMARSDMKIAEALLECSHNLEAW